MKRGRHQRPDDPWVEDAGEPEPLTKEQLSEAAQASLGPRVTPPSSEFLELSGYRAIGGSRDGAYDAQGELTPEALSQVQDYIDESVSEADEIEPTPIEDLDFSIDLVDPDEVGIDLWRGRTRMWSVKIGKVNPKANLDRQVYELPIHYLSDNFDHAVSVFTRMEELTERWDNGETVFIVEHPPDAIFLSTGFETEIPYARWDDDDD